MSEREDWHRDMGSWVSEQHETDDPRGEWCMHPSCVAHRERAAALRAAEKRVVEAAIEWHETSPGADSGWPMVKAIEKLGEAVAAHLAIRDASASATKATDGGMSDSSIPTDKTSDS